jgi:hypothetical protein
VAEPTDDSSSVEPWVVELVQSSIDTLISAKRVLIDTTGGVVYVSLNRSRLQRGAATFAIASVRNDGAKSDRQKPVRVGRDEDLRAVLVPALTRAITDLVGE